jgi:hypothetical protein
MLTNMVEVLWFSYSNRQRSQGSWTITGHLCGWLILELSMSELITRDKIEEVEGEMMAVSGSISNNMSAKTLGS